MSYIQKIFQVAATFTILATQVVAESVDFLSASLSDVSDVVELRYTEESTTKQRNQQLTSQILADMQGILQSTAAAKAIAAVRAEATRELFNKKAHMVLLKFYSAHGAIFSQFSQIYTVFIQELLRTMSLSEILENFGLNTSSLGISSKTTPLHAVDSQEDDAAKDAAITGILKKGKTALTSIISFGIGSIISVVNVVQEQAKKLINQSETTIQSPEEILQAALRVALKKNLTRAQLEALHAFSKTIAFEILVEIAPKLQALFLETLLSDEQTAAKLMAYYVMASNMAEEMNATSIMPSNGIEIVAGGA